MQKSSTLLKGNIAFKLRFNTAHGDTDLYWRVIVDDTEYLTRSVRCKVETCSDASFDKTAGVVKYHIAGVCSELMIDENLNAVFK
jgi:hypothetical protein